MATVAKSKNVLTFQFEDLPVEIDIKVMSYLDITDLKLDQWLDLLECQRKLERWVKMNHYSKK